MWSKLQSAVWSPQIVTVPTRIKYPTGLHSWRVSKMSHKCCLVQSSLACMCLLACVCLKCSVSSGGKMDDWKGVFVDPSLPLKQIWVSKFKLQVCKQGGCSWKKKKPWIYLTKICVTVNLKREIEWSAVIIIIIIIVILDEFERWKVTSSCNSQSGLLVPQGALLLLPRG